MDSFIDVMSNSIGVLTIILLFAAVVASRTRGLVPSYELIAEKTIYNFEAREDKIYFVDHYTIMKMVIDNLREIKKLETEEERLAALTKVRIEHEGYRVVSEALPAGVIRLLPDPGGGTPIAELSDRSSEFHRVLDALNPEEDMLLFVVRMNGWEAYRKGVRECSQRGFDSAREIRDNESPIEFVVGSAAAAGGWK